MIKQTRRWLSAAAALLLMGALGVTVAAAPVSAAAMVKTAAAATTLPYRLTGTPLLLVHGFSDDCGSAFNALDASDPGPSATKTVDYFQAHGFPIVKTVGYYSGQWTATYSDNSKHTVSDDANCTDNVQNNSTAASNCGGHGTDFYLYTADPIEHLACLMAWYLYNQPQPVDIIAHSMGGLVVRGAMYFSLHHPADSNTFPPGALPVSRFIEVATPNDGLQGAIAQLYNDSYGSQEVRDMTVCPNYGASCTLSSGLNPIFASVSAVTSAFMATMRTAGKPVGSVDTYSASIGSSTVCNPLSARTLGSCVARKAYNLDYFTSSDFVVQADSQMAMPADTKVFYGDIEHIDTSGNITDYNSGATGYAHEANTCTGVLSQTFLGFLGPGPCATSPYYLNDGRTGTTKAWVCATGCNGGVLGAGIANLPYTSGSASASTVPYALGEIAHLLLDPTRSQIGHAAHAENDYPYAGLGLDGKDEGTDAWDEYYGQCDGFAAWKVYENLGGAQRPSAASLPALGWRPSDASISPVVSYAEQSSKAGTWGDAHDWIRSDQGLHAAPYFGVPFDNVPQPGSIAVWQNTAENPTGGMSVFGHVAYVTDVVDANTIRIESYNMQGNGLWTAEQVTRSGGGVDTGYGGSFAFGWPAAFVHLGDGPAGAVQGVPANGNSYPIGTYGPTSASGGPSFALAGATVGNGDVHGWYVSRAHGVIGWQLWTNTHTGDADSTATWTPTLATPNGCYRVDAFVPNTWSNSSYALYTVTDQRFGTSVVPVDENPLTNQYATLGVFQADASGRLPVQLTDQGPPNATHQVAADGMRYVPTSCSGERRTALVIDPTTPGYASTDVWYPLAAHGLRGNERYTHSNGTTAVSTATYTPTLPVGCYQVDAYVPDNYSDSPAALYTITDAAFTTPTLADVDEADTTSAFVTLGVFETRADGTMSVKLTDQNPTGLWISADAVRFTPASCSNVSRWSDVIDPGTASPDFTSAGITVGNGDVHGWYHTVGGGLRGNQWWTYAMNTTPSSTATYSPSGLPRAGGCFDIRAFVPNNHANNTRAGYAVAVTGPSSGYGESFGMDQSTPTNAWIDLGKFSIPANGYVTVTVTDTGPTTGGPFYTSADAIDFRAATGC